MSHEERISDLEEQAAYIPLQIGTDGLVPDGMYQAWVDPGNNYPVPPQANTFYAYPVSSPAFSPIVGLQNFVPTQGSPGEYCLNLGSLGYVVQGTVFFGFHSNGQLYCRLNGPAVFYGTTTAPSNGSSVGVYVTASQGGPSGFTTTFSTQAYLPISWPVIALGNVATGAPIIWNLNLEQEAVLTTDVYPGNYGTAVLSIPTGYPNITAQDAYSLGGSHGEPCKVFYTSSGWILENTSTCNE